MKVSVIIPAYNEAEVISSTIEKIRKHAGGYLDKILVVDGGSTDDTVTRAEEAGAKVMSSFQKGRAAQMNYGARKVEAEILYFLHADTVPPEHFDRKIHGAVSRGYKSGCFRLAFDDSHWLLRSYAWFTRFDIDAFRFGDQSLFVKADTFSKMKGFKEDHLLMEDNEMVRRLKKEHNFTILDETVVTSARSYRRAGVVKLQLTFVLIYFLYFLGVKQEKLVALKAWVLH